jgi:hypothetical protein
VKILTELLPAQVPSPLTTRLSPLNSTQRIFLLLLRGSGELLTVPFKLMHLGAADATSEASLAAHRCSKRL